MLFFIAGDNLLFSYLHQETTIFSKFLFLYRVLHWTLLSWILRMRKNFCMNHLKWNDNVTEMRVSYSPPGELN